jgi:hypothetical protein
MIFEVGDLKFITPLDLTEGKRYIEPTRGNQIENLYNMNAWMDDYVNFITLSCIIHAYLASCPLTCYFFQAITKQLFLKTIFLKMYTPCTTNARVHTLVAPLQLTYIC